jgi:beta-N-acetylhexosaminidase
MKEETKHKRQSDSIGQLFVCSYRGERPPESFLSFLKKEQIGGVILFADNCPTHEIARENIRVIQEQYTDTIPFIAIDQEGGRVCRLKGAPAEFAAAEEYATRLGLDAFRQDYSRAAMYMESLGINLNLAPVCDLFIDPKNTCMSSRCYGSDPQKAAAFVKASVEVAHHYGLLSCCKHFPGLGDASIDPHVGASKASYTQETFYSREQIPFQAGIDAGVDMVMTTHLQVKSFDSTIITGSRKVVTNLLREQMGFDGVIITDDLTMGGAAPLGTIGQRAIAALNAGHDIVLFGQDFEAAKEAYQAVCEAVRNGTVPMERIDSALRSISGLKSTLRRVHIS